MVKRTRSGLYAGGSGGGISPTGRGEMGEGTKEREEREIRPGERTNEEEKRDRI